MLHARTASWLLPAIAALLLFLPVLGAGFVHDDVVLLRDNPNIQSWDGVARGFSEPYWHIAEDPRTHVGGFYRPLGVTAFVLLHQLGGGSPLAYHGASLLLHALCSALVALLALRLGWRPLAAGAAGLLFALHGMHVEPVAWASSLTYLMATAGALAGLLALQRGRWLLAGLALAAGMLSQEAAIGAWALAVGWQLFRADLDGRPRWPGLAALGGAALLVWALRWQAFGGPAAGFFGRPITVLAVSPAEQWAIAFSVQLQELRYLIWPWPHAPFRPLPSPQRVGLGDAERWLPALGGLMVLLVAAVWGLRGALRMRRGAAAPALLLPVGLCFAGMLPLLSVSNLGQFPFEERFLYLPSAGSCLAMGWLLTRHRLAVAAGLGLLGFHTWSAAVTTPHWADESAFFDWGKQASPNTMLPFTERGRLLLHQAAEHPPGHPERLRLAGEAELDFAAGLELQADEWLITSVDRLQGNLGLASALFYQGLLDVAEDAYRQILEAPLGQGSFQARHGLGSCLAERGLAAWQEGEEEEGRKLLEAALAEQIGALELAPDWPAALHAKGLVLLRLGRAQEAVAPLERAAALDAASRAFRFDLAQAYWEAGRNLDFDQLVQSLLDAEPDPVQRAEVRFRAGALQIARAESLLPQGLEAARPLIDASLSSFEAAVAEDPRRFDALQGIASCYEMMGQPERALEPARRAFEAQPYEFIFAQTLFRLQLAAGRPEQGRQTLEVWLRAAPEEDPARPLVVQTLREWR